MSIDQLPRQLTGFGRPAGTIKGDYTDFVVDELPLYPAAGSGTHTYFHLEKAGLTTTQAIQDIARALGVPRRNIGFAGLKDARAVTRQWLSVEHIDPERVAGLNIPRLRILETTRHQNKLRLGHLAGNRFTIRVRNTDTERLPELEDALAQLGRVGVPNYFGSQRFGYRGDTWRVGAAIVRNCPDEALDTILGQPNEHDTGHVRRARQLYDTGQYSAAAGQWPGMFRAERRALKALARRANPTAALRTFDKPARAFFVSAYQSYLFNQVVAARLQTGLGRLQEGDLAWIHANGAVFLVEDASREQPRADDFEISPTGPLFGPRMSAPGGLPGELEQVVLSNEELPPDALARTNPRPHGGRRPLRFRPADAKLELGADDRGAYLELRFALARGCYATALLRELFEPTEQRGPDSGINGAEAHNS